MKRVRNQRFSHLQDQHALRQLLPSKGIRSLHCTARPPTSARLVCMSHSACTLFIAHTDALLLACTDRCLRSDRLRCQREYPATRQRHVLLSVNACCFYCRLRGAQAALLSATLTAARAKPRPLSTRACALLLYRAGKQSRSIAQVLRTRHWRRAVPSRSARRRRSRSASTCRVVAQSPAWEYRAVSC